MVRLESVSLDDGRSSSLDPMRLFSDGIVVADCELVVAVRAVETVVEVALSARRLRRRSAMRA